MGFFNNFIAKFTNESDEPSNNNENTTVQDETTWITCEKTVNRIWQYEYALAVVCNILTVFLSNVEWKTYKKGVVVKGEEWFRFNYAPNKKETSNEFYQKLSKKLVYNGQALIIETATRELFIADSYEFKGGQELLMKDNTFINVQVGNIKLNRSFKENETCMYIKMPQSDEIKEIFNVMANDYYQLKQLIIEGADKALGMKLSLNLGATAKNKYDEKTIKAIQKTYEPLMKSRNAVFLTYKGEQLSDLTERQRGNEVQQVLEAVDNNIKVNNEILTNVGSAYGIPKKFMTGDYNQDNTDNYIMAITMFGKPVLTLISKKYTLFVLEKEDIVSGSKVEANLDSIKFVESLNLATAIDKLIGSGAYTINEVREKIGDDPVENGDVRFVTKNYAILSEYMKGGG